MRRFLVQSATRVVLSCLLVVLFACGGDGGTNPPPPPTVSTVSVALASATIAVGQTTTATAVARDAGGSVISGKTATWTSSAPAVATVDAGGTVTGISVGSSAIVATVDGKTGQTTVTVTPPAVASVTVTLSSPGISEGQTTQGTAVVRDGGGSVLTGRTITWSSSNAAVATVSGTGLVSGVSAGTANIVATSEGITGSAAVTVSQVLSVSALVLQSPSGQPLDETNVAGEIQLAFEQQLPNGFAGVLEVKIDGVVFSSDNVFGAVATLNRVIPRTRSLQTAGVVSTFTADELISTPRVLNGNRQLAVSLTGAVQGGQPLSSTVLRGITLNNADAARLHVLPQRSTLIDGRQVFSGNTDMVVEDISYSGQAIEDVEVVRLPYSTTYGSGAAAGAVVVTTRSGANVRKRVVTLPSAYETLLPGDRYALGSYTRGGVHYSLGDIVQLNGNTASPDGTGLAGPFSGTLGSGLTYQYIPSLAAGVLPAGFVPATSDPFWFDDLPPRATATAFAPPPRTTTIGHAAWNTSGLVGLSDNYLGSTTNLSSFVDISGFTDASGLDLSPTLTYYASKNLSTLFDIGNTISDVSSIPASSTRDWYLGLTLSDRAMNRGTYVAQTNLVNPLGTGTNALFGRLAATPVLDVSGVSTGAVINASTFSQSLHIRATGSLFPTNAFYGVAYKYGDAASCYVGLAGCSVPEVLGGIVSGGGSQVDLDLSIQYLANRRSSVEGGNGDGFLSGTYWAADHGGNWASGGYSGSTPFNVLIDRVAPTTALSVTFPTTDQVRATYTASDGIGLEHGEIGAGFDWNISLISTGQLWIPIADFELGGNLTTGLNKNATQTFDSPFLTTGRFFDLNTGLMTSTAFRSNRGYAATYDWAHNVTRTFQPITNTAPLEAAPTNLRLVYSAGGNVCGGTTCAGGEPTSRTVQLDAFSPDALSPIEKVSFLGIPSDKIPRLLNFDIIPETMHLGAEYRHRYEFEFRPGDLCIPLGFYYYKVAVLLAGGRQMLFPGSFPTGNIVSSTAGGDACGRPRRDLGFSATWSLRNVSR